jgi:thioesterase domain-containing protein/acyl carrier protein
MQRKPGLRANDSLLGVTTLSFDIAGLEIYLPLITGARLVLASRTEAADGRLLLDLMRRTHPTVMQATPATWRMLIEAGWKGTRDLKVLCGGEALPGDLSAQLLPRCGQLRNMYGPTETTIWSSVYRVQSATTTAPIGRPIANTTFYILDARMQPVPIGVGGELYIGGEGVARGYLHRPDLTSERFVPDPFAARPGARIYRTGDVARYLPDANVQYLGRSDFQVKVRGFRIELGEIESVLSKHPAVQECVVITRQDTPGDTRLVAYAVAAFGFQIDPAELRAWTKEHLPAYMVPSAIVGMDALPLTPNGKVDRRSLPKPELSASKNTDFVPPRDEIELALAKIWQEILGVSPVGVTDNFFDLGGHSLLAVRLLTEIKSKTGKDIPLTALFQGATVEYLADIVRGKEAVEPTVIHKIQPNGTRPPFFAAVVAGVNALGYVPLAKHLGGDQPFYALQQPGPGPRLLRRPFTQQEYEEIATAYIAAMRTIQPEGPYHLGGFCEGAHIAFEMTRQLELQGEKVNLLAMFDTWVIENTQNRRLWRFHYYAQRLRQLGALPLRSMMTAFGRAISNRVQWALRMPSAPPKSQWGQAYWPSQNFVAKRINTQITIFKVPRQPYYYSPDPLLGWGPRTSGGVDAQIVKNGRHRLLLREPYVRGLATVLSQKLKQIPAVLTPVPISEKGIESDEVPAL